MPIPPFDGILNVLPPHLGDPRKSEELSPYPCTMVELCESFSTSPARKAILVGFLNLRRELLSLGIQGFQWLDGSFVENVEIQMERDPNDIDVVTFVAQPTQLSLIETIQIARSDLFQRDKVKPAFSVDHFILPLCSRPEIIVELTRYWYGLFSHRRDCVWKGMLRVDLTTTSDDAMARNLLENKP